MSITDPQLPARQKLIKEVTSMMGGNMIDLQMEPDDFNTAFQIALDTYRQRSGNAMIEEFSFLDVQPDTSEYQLPNEIQEVRQVYRRTIGGSSGGAAIDPFSLAFTNNIYMIQNPGALGGTGAGTLATYDMAMQYQMLVGRMFGMFVNFTYNSATHKLLLHRKVSAQETFCLHVYTTRGEEQLLADYLARPWLRSYTLALCKQIVGEARSLYSSFGGPQGGVSMNGDSMKSEAKEMMDKLEEELRNFVDQHEGMPFVVG